MWKLEADDCNYYLFQYYDTPDDYPRDCLNFNFEPLSSSSSFPTPASIDKLLFMEVSV